MAKEKSCEERWVEHYDSRMEDITALVEGAHKTEEGLQELNEYGLAWDWVAQDGKKAGYFRWQLSYGGPSDEFRFYPSIDLDHHIEYWFMDWFDGHGERVTDEHAEILGKAFDLLGIGEFIEKDY